MSKFSWLVASASALAVWAWFPHSAMAQYSAVTSPLNGASSSYFERIGVGFSGNIGNNVFFNNGGAGGALPPFGGHVPGGGANFGFGLRGNGFNLNFNGIAESGSDRGITSVAPTVTVPNGGTGQIFSGSLRPFVTGLVPNVGSFGPGIGYTMSPPPVTTSPLVERLVRMQDELAVASRRAPSSTRVSDEPATSEPPRTTSSAERGDLSLSAIRAQQAGVIAQEEAELAAILEAARLREEAGEYGQALIDYGRAAARAKGELREELRIKMRELRAQAKK